MDFALKRMNGVQYKQEKTVSILVLMDFALKPEKAHQYPFTIVRFNPCFDGFCS